MACFLLFKRSDYLGLSFGVRAKSSTTAYAS